MKLFSILALAVCSLALSGCLKDNTSGADLYNVSPRGQAGGGGSSGSSCRAASSQLADDSNTQSPCPSSSGQWTLNIESYSNGSITGNEVYCGYPDSDVIASQAAWDSYVSSNFGGSVSANQDYRSGANCASMSATNGSVTVHFIYTKAQ